MNHIAFISSATPFSEEVYINFVWGSAFFFPQIPFLNETGRKLQVFFFSLSCDTNADATFSPERWNCLQSQVAIWKLSLRAAFLPVFFCKGLKQERGCEHQPVSFTLQQRGSRRLWKLLSSQGCLGSCVTHTCKAFVCCSVHLSSLTDKHLFARLQLWITHLSCLKVAHTPEIVWQLHVWELYLSEASECFTTDPQYANGAETGGRNPIFITTSPTTFHFPAPPQLKE